MVSFIFFIVRAVKRGSKVYEERKSIEIVSDFIVRFSPFSITKKRSSINRSKIF